MKLKLTLVVLVVGLIAFVGILSLVSDRGDPIYDIITNNYIQIGQTFELETLAVIKDTSTLCKETTEQQYKTSSGWKDYGSSGLYQNPFLNSLVSRSTGQEIIDMRGVTYLKCNFPDTIKSMKITSGTVKGFYTDTDGKFSTGSLGVTGDWIVVTNAVPLLKRTMLDNVSYKVATYTIGKSNVDKIENALTPDSLGRVTMAIQSQVSIIKFDITRTDGSVFQGFLPDGLYHSSMRFDKTVDEINFNDVPDVSINKDQAHTIEKIYQSIDSSKANINGGTLDTTETHGRQITILIRMADWTITEGSPQIVVKRPSGSIYDILGTVFDHQTNQDAIFLTRITLPQQTDAGTWTFQSENINRSQKPIGTLNVVFNVSVDQAPSNIGTTTPDPTFNDPVPTCSTGEQLFNNICVAITQTVTDDSKIEFVRLGIIWEAIGFNNEVLDNGDSRTDGSVGQLIGNLERASLISERVNDDGTSTAFKLYYIKPYMSISEDNKVIDSSKLVDYKLGLSQIQMELVMEGGSNQSPIERSCFEACTLQTSANEIIPLGWLTITRDNVEEIAIRNQLDRGDIFTVKATLKGDFTIVNVKTGQTFIGFADGIVFSNEFVYGELTKASVDKTQDLDRQNHEPPDDSSWLCRNLGLGCPDRIEGAETTEPTGNPQTKEGVSAICETGTLLQCASAELQFALGESNTKDLDNALAGTDDSVLIIVAVIIIVLGLVVYLKRRTNSIRIGV